VPSRDESVRQIDNRYSLRLSWLGSSEAGKMVGHKLFHFFERYVSGQKPNLAIGEQNVNAIPVQMPSDCLRLTRMIQLG
jgi:hypothetical protein